ncbi:mannose-6-phosphate isomerase, class I [Lentibacillus cibarius]|uniref:Mannose-6-phosphate isomerase n=1 Tax=Lentibacillus cibarius TaxID=2583219 RepID=A0A5S3QJ45_9BACI|nr:mannose-6-phosphate isomerase, class I [Lentibacillus cibarius]TMN21747.1 mannose-6-phosphate isomerase, class I [Lentibacillus cibarius]
MYSEPIFLQPVFQERIWGGQKLQADFNYAIPSDHTGEAWGISAHPNGPNLIENGPLKGKTLRQAWNEYGELFNRKADNNEDYPLLVKILDAKTDLSVQVHPDDSYAREVENQPYGKTECWYVLSAEPDAELVLGHHAKTREELDQLLAAGEWDKLLKRVKVKAGDFVHVPSGTIHAIGSGIVILETQQSSDITYRVYDYDRTDAEGNKRELHLDKAADVTTILDQPAVANQFDLVTEGDLTIKRLVEDPYFTVEHWELGGTVKRELTSDFLQVSVVEGNGKIVVGDAAFDLEKGTNFIVPNTVKGYKLTGEASFIVSWV